MNDEIKEILDRLEKIGFYASVPKELAYMTTNITPQECKTILDYITNLQQENNNLKTSLDESQEVVIDLQQENERLEHENFCLREYLVINKNSIPNDLTKDKNFMEIIDMPTYEDYKSRIEKAVEYIKEHIKYECDDAFNGMQFYSYHLYNFSKDDLLNILNGRSDE